MSIDSEQYVLPTLQEKGRNTERGELSSTVERAIQVEIARLNQLYKKTGISFAQAKDMPGMIEAHKSGRGVCRFFSNVAEQNGRVTVTYHIYEPRKDGTFLTTVSEDDLGGVLEILKPTGNREIVGDGTATKALHLLKTTNISGQEFFDLLSTEFSHLSAIEKAKFVSILSLGSAGVNMDAVAVVLNQVYNSYMKLSSSEREQLTLGLAFLPAIIPSIAGKYGSKGTKKI